MKMSDGKIKDVEDLTDEELNTMFVFLQGRIKVNSFVSEKSKNETHDDFIDVQYEIERRERVSSSSDA